MKSHTVSTSASPRTLLVGAPAATRSLSRVLMEAEPGVVITGYLDLAQAADGDLERAVKAQAVERVLITVPMSLLDAARRLGERLDAMVVAWRFMPTFEDQLSGAAGGLVLNQADSSPATRLARAADPAAAIHLTNPCAIDPVQLLDRHPAPLDVAAIARIVAGRTVMITGAGGSIGSELARIVCRFNPGRLVLVERGENALFEIDRDIARLFPKQSRAAVLHDVTDAPRTLAVVMAQKPDLILHAAAHKHVPMMEDHPAAAVENNFYGTRAIADAAAKVGTGRFVMISTDKAVNPSSVMGATKRLAELYIQHKSTCSDTIFSMVRFGNVLGSACSVLPIWSKQLAQGDPITVTHPEMTRYFMTIPEAAGLVLQSAALAGEGTEARRHEGTQGQAVSPSGPTIPDSGLRTQDSGLIFLLDMGRPIRIIDMARRFIRSQGLEPDVDVPIVFTGPRPGEKLHEELAYDSEGMLPTPHASIRIWQMTPPSRERMKRIIRTFDELRASHQPGGHHWQHASDEQIVAALRQAIPEMRRPISEAPLRQSA